MNCNIIPKVNNKEGNPVDSILFKDLVAIADRKSAKEIYLKTKTDAFIENWLPLMEQDNNGEPTINSLLLNTNLETSLGVDNILHKLNRKIGYYKRGQDRPALWIDNNENAAKLKQKAIDFNQNSKFKDQYIAKVINIQDNEGGGPYIGIKVLKNNKLLKFESQNVEINDSLNKKLEQKLNEWGVAVGALNELDRRDGAAGVTDFDSQKRNAEGLIEIIRLAKGEQGQNALPEEFGHFAFAAIGETELTKRLINLLSDSAVLKEILGEDYERYNRMYQGETVKLAKEVAGKLIGKHLLRNEEIPSKPYKNLLSRLISYIKNFFAKMNATDVQKAIYEADKEFSKLAKDIMNSSQRLNISLNNVTETGQFFSLTDKIERDQKLLNDIINNEIKRLRMYKNRDGSTKFISKQQKIISRLESSLLSAMETDGILDFVSHALEELKKVDKRLSNMAKKDVSMKEKASILRDVRNYVLSYSESFDEIRANLREDTQGGQIRYDEAVRTTLSEASEILKDMFSDYNRMATPMFVEFMKPFLGENVVIPFGKRQGEVIKAEDLLKEAKSDITFMDRWLDSMAHSSDFFLKVMDKAVKQKKEQSRFKVIEDVKRISKLARELEKKGYRDFEFMFEVDNEGNKTGEYVQEINYGQYYKDLKEFHEYLNEKYGENPVAKDQIKRREELNQWFSERTVLDASGQRVPMKTKPGTNTLLYGSHKFEAMDENQKAFYDEAMQMKSELDQLLPEGYTSLHNAVKIRKNMFERMKESSGLKEGTFEFIKGVQDMFIRRSDNLEIGMKIPNTDFENRAVQTLPVYYTKFGPNENMNDISTDIVQTFASYAKMARDYNSMNEVIDILEIGRTLHRDRKVGQHAEEKAERTNLQAKLDDFFEMQVYQRYMKDEGNVLGTKMDAGKTANMINMVTAVTTLGVNALAGVANVSIGKIMMRSEAVSGRFFNYRDLVMADKLYAGELPGFLGELGNRIRTNKLALWSEHFNTVQEFHKDIQDINFNQKTWFSRMFGVSALFFINNAGEHWMQTRTSLALANNYKMLDNNGNEVSLWDSMDVEYLDPDNPSLGARLVVKEGYTKLDGTEFTDQDRADFTRKNAGINHYMHGIYNQEDRNAFQRLAIGRMSMMFRKWMKPAYNRRFARVGYNYDVEDWMEGYYRTTGRFLWEVAKDLTHARDMFNDLSHAEKTNIYKALYELGHLLALMILGAVLFPPDDKPSERSYAMNMLEYQIRRTSTELGAMTPSPDMVFDLLKLLRSPAAGLQTIESTLGLIRLVQPSSYQDRIQTGRYKGKTKAYKYLKESPLSLIFRTLDKVQHPEELIPFYKQNTILK